MPSPVEPEALVLGGGVVGASAADVVGATVKEVVDESLAGVFARCVVLVELSFVIVVTVASSSLQLTAVNVASASSAALARATFDVELMVHLR